jgi:acetyl coenzyme A synthetase (ADP forming)-like protein
MNDTTATTLQRVPASTKPDLDTLVPLFRPRSVAVIGASRDPGTVGGALFHNLLSTGFSGAVYPVNPKSSVVQSVAAYPTIEAIPGEVDLAIIVVPAAVSLAAVEACARKGVKGVVVISAGYKETGERGRELEQKLVDVVRANGMRLIGPNCLGILNTEAGVRLNATFSPTYPPPGAVAFSSQSGALGLAILEYAAQLNIGISHFVSVGNKADVSGNDLLEFWERDPGTKIILLYLESFGNPRRFTQIARRVARTKPIVAVKSGRTSAGRRAASSHTGSIAGTDAAVEAVCRQAGVIRTDTMEELFDVAMLLANQPVPLGRRVGIVSNAGGPGIMASDACESHGLEVPLLREETLAELRAFLPPEASTKNPVDMIASATPASFERATAAVLADPGVDALLVLYVPPIVTTPSEIAEAIVRGVAAATRRADEERRPHKPVLSCFMGTHGVQEGLRTLHEGHIPSYAFPESAAMALARAVRHGQWRAADEGRFITLQVDTDRATAVLEMAAARGGGWLRPDEVSEVLDAYGIPQLPLRLAVTEDEAVAAAEEVGFPVVHKLHSDTLTHKSDVGGVALDLRNAAEVRKAWRSLRERLTAAGRLGEMQGALIQPLVREGIETILGMSRDPKFGPLVMFGLGGIYVEMLKDVSFRLAPLTDRDAREMMEEVRAFPLLKGYRGAPPADLAALESLILRVSQLSEEQPLLLEMDLNPVRALAPGRGVVAIDARLKVGPGAG